VSQDETMEENRDRYKILVLALHNKHEPQFILRDDGWHRTCGDPMCPQWRNGSNGVNQHAHLVP
jgi:hypothetical protein